MALELLGVEPAAWERKLAVSGSSGMMVICSNGLLGSLEAVCPCSAWSKAVASLMALSSSTTLEIHSKCNQNLSRISVTRFIMRGGTVISKRPHG